jgi:hypothetical protein
MGTATLDKLNLPGLAFSLEAIDRRVIPRCTNPHGERTNVDNPFSHLARGPLRA